MSGAHRGPRAAAAGHPALSRALERLYRRATYGIRPGTARVAQLCERLGLQLRHRVEPPLAIAHVAGTNGKGSVCAMLESLARAHGLRTALYTSPHLVRFHERIRVAGRPITDAELADRIAEVEETADALWPDPAQAPTFFEIATAVAFRHFDLAHTAFRVIEVGMGGALDATNVLHPTVSVITGIDLDHTEHLGSTRPQVAREKAGIIKPDTPVVMGPVPTDAREVIERTAAERGAPLHEAADLVQVRRLEIAPEGQWLEVQTAKEPAALILRLPLLGAHQTDNLVTALAAFQVMLDRFAAGGAVPPAWPTRPVSEATRHGLEHVVWPARMQRLHTQPEIWLDGAHNPQAASALAATLRELGDLPTALVTGMMADKDAVGFFQALAPRISRAWTVPIASERAAAPTDLARSALIAGLAAEAASSVETALSAATDWATRCGGRVLIAGSLYLAGEVLAQRGGDRLFEDLPEGP